MPENKEKTPNRLITETSPYLLQHAYNPVDWFPWQKKAFEKAEREHKPVLVSIGYSSCHWCHVMERESFENEGIARFMNEHFICIKVDREERPDVDQVYMTALQAMNLRGGWPLNVFLTPEGKPFYGGTYFPPQHWQHLLQQVDQGFRNHRKELEKSAEDFTRVLNYSESEKYDLTAINPSVTDNFLQTSYRNFSKRFDEQWGGTGQAPKFPMPSNWLFLLRYYHLFPEPKALRQINLTLEKMAFGGIYDHIGGGFARYSTDTEWFAPHFEKMLYDNGQLLSLYSQAWLKTQNTLYKTVVYETIHWLKREMMHPKGGFFSAQDADSEGQEGQYYVWEFQEMNKLLVKDFDLFCDYYSIQKDGNWEEGKNILFRKLTNKAFAAKHNLSENILDTKVLSWKRILLEARNKKEKPGLDDKILCSWNAILLNGLTEAYRIFNDDEFLDIILANARFIKNYFLKGSSLRHSWKNDRSSETGFLDDYVFCIQAFINLYEATFEEEWLWLAKNLNDSCIREFYDEKEEMFFYTSEHSDLIARQKEVFDNVIPSSNSVMARNLHALGHLFGNHDYLTLSKKMVGRIQKMVSRELSYTANWAILLSDMLKPTVEIAISGPDALNKRKELDRFFIPNKIIAGTHSQSSLPLLENRSADTTNTFFFVCSNHTCQLPVKSTEDAIQLIQDMQSL